MVRKNQGIRLEPLNAKVENNVVLDNVKRKFPHRLNPPPTKHVADIDQKRPRSKIPVLQKKSLYPKHKDVEYPDTFLSAADRRQKFQQSRLRVMGADNLPLDPVFKKQPAAQYCCDIFPWYEGFFLHKFMPPPPPPAYLVNQKNVLPPIKPVDASFGSLQKTNQTKSKCLLGEFTHFPALLNPVCLNGRKPYTSTVPHLPPIMPLPPAPPPSISTSLEKANKKIFDNDWNPSKSVFQNVIPVSF